VVAVWTSTDAFAQAAPEVEAVPVSEQPSAPEAAPAPPAADAAVSNPAAVSGTSPAAAADLDISAYLSDGGGVPASAQAETSALRLYGFADFSVGYIGSKLLTTILGEQPSFMLGNLNLYAAADLSERWKSLVEVRFMFTPDGTLDANYKRISTDVSDYATSGGGNVRWGSINIERAWLEYSAHELLTVRVGAWLTPVGIWNVDHGTPSIIPSSRPYVINSQLFPTRQTGVELYGSRLFGEMTLGYHLTVSNGRGSVASYADLDKNKAIGARLYGSTQLGEATLTVGASMYTGRATDAGVKASISGLSKEILQQYDELSWAGDLLFKWEGLHLQSELFAQQVKFTNAGQAAPVVRGPGGGVIADYMRIGFYAVLAYRLPWLPLMPFLQLERVWNGGFELYQPGGIGHEVGNYGAGLNYRPIATVTLKLQYTHTVLSSVAAKGERTDSVQAVVAWSF
jgi:hypothetical protein